MKFFGFVRLIALLSAVLAYAGNGAQTHLHFSADEAVSIAICGLHSNRTLTLDIKGEPPQLTPETCCGDRDLNGPQLETDMTLTLGWQKAF